jgi:hypothetical protein
MIIYLGRVNLYKVCKKTWGGIKHAKFRQRGYAAFGKDVKIQKLNKRVRYYFEDGNWFVK